MADRKIRHSNQSENHLIFAFVRSLIGSVGRAIMDFYLANSLIINSIVLFYGLLVFIGRRNYSYILHLALSEAGIYDSEESRFLKKKLSRQDYEKIDWAAVRKQARIPYFVLPKKWLLVFTSEDQLTKKIQLDEINSLIEQVNASRKG